jgi:hypothetical protein
MMALLIALRRRGAKHSSRVLLWISGCEVVALESLCANLPACNFVCNVACNVACNANDLYYADLAPSDSWYPPSIYFQPMKFIVLGDPTTRVR